MKRNQSFSIALCGVFGALSVVVMLLGSIVPIAMYIAPALAALLVVVAIEECDKKMAATLYLAVSLISLLFVPEREVAFVYVFLLGYYPLIKDKLDGLHPKWKSTGAKLLLFNVSLAVAYGLLALLFLPGLGQMHMATVEWVMTIAIWLLGNLSFYLFDRAIVVLLLVYRIRLKPRLHHMLRH